MMRPVALMAQSLLLFCIHQLNWLKPCYDLVMTTAPETFSWVLVSPVSQCHSVTSVTMSPVSPCHECHHVTVSPCHSVTSVTSVTVSPVSPCHECHHVTVSPVSPCHHVTVSQCHQWPVATYGCEARTLKKEEERCVQAFENKCTRKLLRISWMQMTNNEKVYQLAGTEQELMSYIKSRELRFFGHVMRKPHDTIEASIMTGLVEVVRRRGRPQICWFDNIQAWTGLSGTALLSATRHRLYWTALTHPCSQPLRTDMTWHYCHHHQHHHHHHHHHINTSTLQYLTTMKASCWLYKQHSDRRDSVRQTAWINTV